MNKAEVVTVGKILIRMKQQDIERSNLAGKVNEIHVCLSGENSDHSDDGLIGSVNRNTRFRHGTGKILWIIITAIVGLGVWVVRSSLVAGQ